MSCNEWKEYTISDACEVSTGFAFKSKEYLNNGVYRVVRGDNVKTGFIQWEEKARYWNDMTEKLSKYILKENDIVVGMDGSRVGKNRAIIKENDLPAILAQRVACIRANDKFYQPYIKYVVMSNEFERYVDSIKTGTSIPHISMKQINEFKFKAPSIEEQEKIANILSSLDDKIELNNDMNNALEEMAKSIFKRWFVDFEFPNEDGQPYKSSGGEMVDSELGMIPKGWEVKELGDIIDSISVKHKFPNNKIIFLNTSDILDGDILHNNYSDVESLPGQAKKSIKKGDILYSEIRPKNKRFTYVNFDADEYVVSTKLMVLRTKNNINSSMIYFYLTSEKTVNYLQTLAESRSGTFPQITFSQIKDIKIALPKGDLITRLGEVFETLLNNIWNNKVEIKELEELRDSLLPKLMSGEIRVN